MVKLFNLGLMPGIDSLVVFHALARLGIEALVIVSPLEPFVSVGYFQDTSKVIDRQTCSQLGLPVVRREVGGGAVLLDQNQIFYQVIVRKNNPLLPMSPAAIYRTLSQAPIQTYNTLGIKAEFKAPNDLVTSQGKKISGQGGANIENCMVFVGNIILDFDFETMQQVFRVPDEKFRAKVRKTMSESMSSLTLELGVPPARTHVEQLLIKEFAKILGPLEAAELTCDIKAEMQRVEQELTAPEFLLAERYQRHNAIKIKSGTYLGQGHYSGVCGLITTLVQVSDKKIAAVEITADSVPPEALAELEQSLLGRELEGKLLCAALEKTIRDQGLRIIPEEVAQAVLNAVPSGDE